MTRLDKLLIELKETFDLISAKLNILFARVDLIGEPKTKTSQLTNDGENGTDPFITASDIPEPQPVDLGERGQIIAIDFNGTTSYGLRGVDRALKHVQIGNDTMDLIRHFSMNQVGIGGDNGFGYGYDLYSAPGSFGSTIFGFNNKILGGQLITMLGQNNIANSGYTDLILGEGNTLSSPLGYTFTSGRNNLQAGRYSGIVGVGIINRGAGTIVGTANTDRPDTTFFDSNNPLFVVGNGTLTNNSENLPLVRSDAFVVLQNGKVSAPSLNLSLINSPKSLVTKEYVDSKDIIQKSPDGTDWKLGVNNAGETTWTQV